ncbi:hypothetical protein K7X08_033912 [Anisodus acutangulus]|uniref:Uncharacterized protein n=1 Tax=Anisodus acutangulus TaxID=402998 RepID=A0A9Q1MWQ7_9SOLA|nr:hypothetical protein K7X08_033912 [Anisodus acutangulus]
MSLVSFSLSPPRLCHDSDVAEFVEIWRKAFHSGLDIGCVQKRYQIGEHKHSLVENSLEIVVLFRDWIRAERRRCGQPEINEEEDENYNEILSEGGGSDVEQFDQQIPIPTEEPHEIIKKLEHIFFKM